MSSKKILTIFGATGNQGGSVVNAILNSPKLSSEFGLRGITRDANSSKAKALASKGVELAEANLDNAGSIKKALEGSYGVFAVTDYWITTIKEDEENQGRNIVDACIATGVKHLVWSSLPNVTKLTDGVLSNVEHFDSKAWVAEYAASKKGESGLIVSNFMPGFFMSNLQGMIKKQENGEVALALPFNAEETWVPLLDIRNDTGKYVAGLFAAGKSADGVSVQGVSQWAHPKEIVSLVREITGQDVKMEEQPLTVEYTKQMDRIPGEMAQNMLLIRDYSYFGKGTQDRQDESDKWLAEGTKKNTWEGFAKANKWLQ